MNSVGQPRSAGRSTPGVDGLVKESAGLSCGSCNPAGESPAATRPAT